MRTISRKKVVETTWEYRLDGSDDVVATISHVGRKQYRWRVPANDWRGMEESQADAEKGVIEQINATIHHARNEALISQGKRVERLPDDEMAVLTPSPEQP